MHISENEYRTSQSLAEVFHVSDRTIRNDLKEMNEVLLHYGAEIISKPKIGNILHVKDRKKFQKYLDQLYQEDEENLPITSRERVHYLLEYLLHVERYVKLDDLCDTLFISKSSLSQDLKEVRKYLEQYNLKLVSKPNYGVRVEGREFDFRLCIANSAIERIVNKDMKKSQQSILKKIGDILQETFDKHAFKMSEVAFQNLIIHIFIAIERIQGNCYVPLEDEQLKTLQKEVEYGMAEEIVSQMEQVFSETFPDSEIGYIAIHLAAKKTIEIDNVMDNMVISDEVNETVSHMLEEVYEAFKIDFLDDFDLRMMLALHLVPFKVRMEYDIILHNPLLKEIKNRYTLAYNIAVAASDVLRECYHKEIKEDEIGYFALHFNLALERKKVNKRKKNILIVCGTGRGTAQLLVYKYKETFGKYLENIYTCDTMSVGKQDFNKIDYIIATVPIQVKVPVPILEVKFFLEDRDIQAVKTLLSKDHNSSISKYFDQRLFLINVEVNNKEEALQKMVEKIREIKEIPDNFYDAVMKREKQAVTEFGNLVAIPHPYRAISKETFVCIMVLNKPILWDKKKVQLIYLMSMEDNMNRNLQQFYKITSKLLMNKDYVKEIIQGKDFNVLLQMFHNIEEQLEMEE